MEGKIFFENNLVKSENTDSTYTNNKELEVKPNLFQGRTEAEIKNAKFPDWDIVPPNQFINPRIKQK